MPIGSKLTDRYEVKQTLGQGGMGVVYWAYDTLIRRDVALKTIRDAPQKAALELFYKECNILASISHPNIIEIFDIGKFQDEGGEKPYFVMPLLKGVTLDNLIANSSRRLTVERTVEILCQTCRGLQAAHENGLVHRDLKPSNIFVLEDDSVKIIDFGVAHMADTRTISAAKGTLLYMSPEQIQLKPATALSDIFTLGVVAYEALTLRRPFEGATHRDIANAILQHIPPPASELNPAVSPLLGRVVHKTMAKQPWNRFSTARDLSEAFQKALRNEPIASFDSAKIQPRIDRATKAFESGDHQFASEILTELESEGHLAPEMAPLRKRIDQAVRQKMLAQLLESARTRMDDHEYPLALQKVQEALEIDPENAGALRFRQEIEASRSTGQVDEWFRLARTHVDRFAFSHARQALDNVLQIRPGDAQAQELMAEIQRREQQYLQLRQEKESLYQSAVADYGKADLSAALTKMERVLELDRKAPEISSAERGATYQGFYNQVRSERDAGMAAYAEARRCLSEDQFDRAIEITEEALKKNPGQALFQALRFDIEDRKRRKLSAYLAEVDRNVEAEPDLDKRVEILRSAAEQFPAETHFEKALKLMRDKRDLVNTIVTKARMQEEQAQFSEALGQWEILRTVYGQYPGLDFEIERVSKRRSQQTLHAAKGRWTEQIDRQIEARDFTRAAGLLRDAQAEFPGDAELEALGKMVSQGEERNAGTQAQIDQGRALCVHGRYGDAVTFFRRAYQADERDLAVRGLLVDALVQHARSLIETNWKRADELVRSALDLDASNVQARSVAVMVDDRKRDEAVDQCIGRSRQLQALGDVSGALATVEQALVLYPTALRLQQLKATLQRSVTEPDRAEVRRKNLEKLKLLVAWSETAQTPKEQREILDGVRNLAAKHLDDAEFQGALMILEKRYAPLSLSAVTAGPLPPAVSPPLPTARPVASVPPPPPVVSAPPPPAIPQGPPELKWPPAPPPGPEPVELKWPPSPPSDLRSPETNWPPTPPVPVKSASDPDPDWAQFAHPPEAYKQAPKTIEFTPAAVPRGPEPVVVPDPKIPPPPPPPVSQPPVEPSRARRLWGTLAASAGLLAALAIGGVVWHQHEQEKLGPAPPPAASTVPVDIRTDPEGAIIIVNEKESGKSNLQLNLAPGTYRINAVREGYRPAATMVTVTAGHNASAALTLQPIPTTLRLLTDFASATVTFDGKPQSNPQSGQLIVDSVAGGSHVLTVGSGTSGVAIHFDAREGAPPVVTSLEAAKDTSAILITNLGAKARIYSSQKAGPVMFDGKPAGALDPLGVELGNVGPGDHEIGIGEGEEHRKVVYQSAAVPALTVYLNAIQQKDVGTLLVLTGEDDVHVSIDGRPVRVVTRRGQLRLPNIPSRQYVIAVSKDGFQPVPEQHVAVVKGEEAKVTFQLKPIPQISMLHVTGAIPGTQILIDGKVIGTAGGDGSIPSTQVTPGSHAVNLRRDEYKPKTFQLNFVAGKDVTLTGADVALEGTFGTLVLAVSPLGAQMTVQRAGEAQARPIATNSVRLPEGSYTVSATAPHFVTQSTTVEIAAGSTKNVTLQLTPERVAPPPKQVTRVGMIGWQASWTPEGDHYTKKGGNLVLFSPQGPGTYSFSATMKHGKQLRWIAHEIDDKNYVEFEIDGEYFYRRQVVAGKGRDIVKKRHGLTMENGVAATVQMTVTPTGIVQRIQGPDGGVVVDSWNDPALQTGRFGMMIRGRDEVNLSKFSFTGVE